MLELPLIIATIESLAAPAIATLIASEILPFVKRTKYNGVLSVLIGIVKAVARELAKAEPESAPAAPTPPVAPPKLDLAALPPETLQNLALALKQADSTLPDAPAPAKPVRRRNAKGHFIKD